MSDIAEQAVDFEVRDIQYKNELQEVYKVYKKLFIRAEEKLEEMNFFVAPMLEHRDAMDHLMKYFSLTDDKSIAGNKAEEALKQLDEALGHEYRAYFDVADYVCITVRSKIAESLKGISKKKIRSVWKDYSDIRKKVAKVSDMIAEIRNNRNGNMTSVKEYEVVLDDIFEIYDDFICNIEPHLYM